MQLTSVIYVFVFYVTVEGSTRVVLSNKCKHFQDCRVESEPNEDINFAIPASLLNGQKETDYQPLNFTLKNENFTLDCEDNKILKIDVTWDETNEVEHTHHFTPEGDFNDGPHFSSVSGPGGYCFYSVSDIGIELLRCIQEGENVENSTSHKSLHSLSESANCPHQPQQVSYWDVVYKVSFTTLFFLATVCVYLTLFDKLNLNGLIILTHSITILLADLSAIPTYFVTPSGNGSGDGICYFIAISAHFFSFASFMWLTLLNFDLWTTFSSMRLINKNSKELKKFAIYSGIAWGTPLLFVLICILIDKFVDPSSSFPVPGYAEVICFIDTKFMEYYLFLPAGLFLAINFILIFLTLKILFNARKKFSGDDTISTRNTYSFKLFGKLFVLMGGAMVIDFISWIHSDYAPLWVEILEYARTLEAVLFFVIVCLNEKILGQLQEKFPSLKGWWGLTKLFSRKGESGSNSQSSSSSSEHSTESSVLLKEKGASAREQN